MSVVVSSNAATAGALFPVSPKFSFHQGGILLAVYCGDTSAHGEKKVVAAMSRDNGVTWGDLDDGPGETILVDDQPFGAGRMVPRADRGMSATLDVNGDLWVAYSATRTNASYVAQAQVTGVVKFAFDGTTWGYLTPIYSVTGAEEAAANYHRRHVLLPTRTGGRCHVSYMRHDFSWRTVTHKVGSLAVLSAVDTTPAVNEYQYMALLEEPNGALHQVWAVFVGTDPVTEDEYQLRHRTAADGFPPVWSGEAAILNFESGSIPSLNPGFAAAVLQGEVHAIVYDPLFDTSHRYRHGIYRTGAWTFNTADNIASDVGFTLHAMTTGDERIVLIRREGGTLHRAIYTDGSWSVGWTSIWAGDAVDWQQAIPRTAVDLHAFAWTASNVLRTQAFSIPARTSGAGKANVGTFNRKGLIHGL